MGKGQYVRLGFSGSLERAQSISHSPSRGSLTATWRPASTLFYKTVDLTSVASFSERDAGGDVRLGFPIADNTQLGLRYKFENEDIFNVSSNASLAVKQSEGRSTSLASATPSPMTHAIFRNCHVRRLRLAIAGFGRRRRRRGYIRSVADARGYYPVTNKITLVGRVQGGAIEGWGGDDVRYDRSVLQGRRDRARFPARRLWSA